MKRGKSYRHHGRPDRHSRRQKGTRPAQESRRHAAAKTNLLIDIQAKLDAGKDAGYFGVLTKSQTSWGEEEQRSGRILGASAQRSRAEFATTRAKVFNLKQMAQTMNYLREHGLLDYGELKEKADHIADIDIRCPLDGGANAC